MSPYDACGKRYLDGLSGLFVVQTRPRPPRAGRGSRKAGRQAGVLSAVVVRPPEGDRAGRPARDLAPGLYCRVDDHGDPVIQLAPPLICEEAHFAAMEQILRTVLTEAWTRIQP